MAVISKMTFDNGSTKNLIGSTFYGKCTTAAATVAKTVTIGGWDESVLDNVLGTTVYIFFENGNSANSPTLSIDGSTAHNITFDGNPVDPSGSDADFPVGEYALTLIQILSGSRLHTYWLMSASAQLAAHASTADQANSATTAASASSVPWSGVTDKPTIPNVPSAPSTNGDYQLNINGSTVTWTSADYITTSQKGASSGVAELDANGKVPSSLLPAYVDDVLEYATRSLFPTTGTSGIIYIATDTNLTYRWSGSDYVEISPSLVLGETSSTAYRGDRGATAYSHATDSSRLTTALNSGLYKFATTAEGHIASATAVQKSDITGLGIPAQDTTYTFDGTYNASTNKAATVKTVTDAIDALDGNVTGSAAASKTLKSFSQTNGVVTAEFEDINITKSQVSDFPASMPASDVSAWAKAATKPSYALSELTGASDVLAIETLTGTSGFLKKTAADTWSLDTNSYIPTSDKGAASGVATLDTNSKVPVVQSNYLYGKCTTAASTAAKTVTIAGYNETTIADMEGVTVFIAFNNPNTASSPTLNVSNTSAHPIAYGTYQDPVAVGNFSSGLHAFTLVKGGDNVYYWWVNEGRNTVPEAPSSTGDYQLNINSNGIVSWTTTSGGGSVVVGTLTLTTTWQGSGPYTLTVSITGGTANSKIDLQPNSTVLTLMTTDGVTAMYIENNNGTFTVYTLGAAPSAALSIQYTRTEVS